MEADRLNFDFDGLAETLNFVREREKKTIYLDHSTTDSMRQAWSNPGSEFDKLVKESIRDKVHATSVQVSSMGLSLFNLASEYSYVPDEPSMWSGLGEEVGKMQHLEELRLSSLFEVSERVLVPFLRPIQQIKKVIVDESPAVIRHLPTALDGHRSLETLYIITSPRELGLYGPAEYLKDIAPNLREVRVVIDNDLIRRNETLNTRVVERVMQYGATHLKLETTSYDTEAMFALIQALSQDKSMECLKLEFENGITTAAVAGPLASCLGVNTGLKELEVGCEMHKRFFFQLPAALHENRHLERLLLDLPRELSQNESLALIRAMELSSSLVSVRLPKLKWTDRVLERLASCCTGHSTLHTIDLFKTCMPEECFVRFLGFLGDGKPTMTIIAPMGSIPPPLLSQPRHFVLSQDALEKAVETAKLKFCAFNLKNVEDGSDSNVLARSQASRNLRSYMKLNHAGRRHIKDTPGNVDDSIKILGQVSDDLDCVFLHLLECPFLCEKVRPHEKSTMERLAELRFLLPPRLVHQEVIDMRNLAAFVGARFVESMLMALTLAMAATVSAHVITEESVPFGSTLFGILVVLPLMMESIRTHSSGHQSAFWLRTIFVLALLLVWVHQDKSLTRCKVMCHIADYLFHRYTSELH